MLVDSHDRLYGALTASLKVQEPTLSGVPMALGASMCLFPRGRQLLQLTKLRLTYTDPGSPLRCQHWYHLVECCPALRVLDVLDTSKYSIVASPLLELTALVSLGGICISGRNAGVLGQLTSLTHLYAHAAPGTTFEHLLQLTALRRLETLRLYPESRSAPDAIEWFEVSTIWHRLGFCCKP